MTKFEICQSAYQCDRYEEAVAAYEEAQLLEPDNKSTRASLTQARAKIADLEKKSTLTSSTGVIFFSFSLSFLFFLG